MIERFWFFLLSLLQRLGLWHPRYRGQHVTDLPDKLKPGTVYIVGDDGYDWSAAMRCPGGCGKTLEMNLLPDAHPAWKVNEHRNGLVSLCPSVWLKTGCKCHFVLQHGRVRWAEPRHPVARRRPCWSGLREQAREEDLHGIE